MNWIIKNKNYLILFASIFGLLWAFLEPFDFYGTLFPNASKVILYIGCLSLSVSITVLTYLYKHFKKPKIHLDRTLLEQELPDLIKSAKRRFWTASIAGYSIVSIDNFESIIEKSLSDGVKFRIVVNDAEKEFIQRRELLENTGQKGRIKNRIKDTLISWNKVIRKLSQKQLTNLEIKINSKDILPHAIYLIDDKIFFISYLYRKLGENSIMVEIEKVGNPEIFSKLEDDFLEIWGESHSI